ncbi:MULTISPECIES: PP2C family protein-serine/threonine phosphatase [Streptomyces]|uniref:Protein phosphatase n=1 Tax=Streptomyces viridochromogenes TaxID=1938 RepID=A0A0L8L9Z3_STRVR|nr:MULTISPECIES: PP2C family protein-serine/threonine phosphatase [Streptomyces]KOG34929.1 protein phosphatase [Streptomyces viridochromogenes]
MAERDEGLLSRVRALERAIGEIGTTLDETTTCRELASFLVRNLYGTSATVDLLADTGGPLRRAAASAPAGDKAATAPDGRGAGSGTTGGTAGSGTAGGAAGSEVTVVAAGSGPAGVAVGSGTAGGAVAGGGSGAVGDSLAVPLAVHDEEPLGTVTVTRAGGAAFAADELALLRHTARLAARHLGHARRLAATEDTALHLQRALVAEPGRPHPNLEIAGGYLPAGHRTLVGGDWFETVRLHFGRSLLVVGDVMGHGLAAAVDMNAYRTALREVAATDLPPHRVLRHLDSVVAEDDARRPATCLLVRVDPARGSATFASAGHLPPVVFAADGSAELVDLPVGPPLGTGVGGYEPATRPLVSGDTLLIFTDGLVERRDEDIDVSLARLAALRLPAGSGPREVVDEVLRRLGAHGAEDDVAVLAARVRARPTS